MSKADKRRAREYHAGDGDAALVAARLVPSPVVRYGYYTCRTGLHGDPALADEAFNEWTQRKDEQPEAVTDGASVWLDVDGRRHVRVTVQGQVAYDHDE